MKKIRACGAAHLIALIVICIMSSVAIACLVISIQGVIKDINKIKFILLIIGSVGLLSCGIYTIVILSRKNITIKNDAIFVAEDIGKSNFLVRKIQHEAIIRFDEIQSLYLVIRNTDSCNKPIPNCVTPMINLVFVCKNGEEKAINLHVYSKRQIIYLIDCVCKKVENISGIKLIESTSKEYVEAFEKSENEMFSKK